MPADDVFAVDIRCEQDGEKMVFGFKVEQQGSDASGVAESVLANEISSAWVPIIRNVMSNLCQIVAIVVRRTDPVPAGQFDLAVGLSGTVIDDALPTQSNVCINLFSDFPTRRDRGRVHIPGVPDSSHDDGVLNNAALADFNTLGDLLINDIADAGWTWSPGVLNTFAIEFRPFTKRRVAPEIRVLRGRRRVI